MNRWQPSVFTPFFSRFTNQKSAELAETEDLYQRVSRLHARFKYADEEAARAFRFELFRRFEECVPEPLRSTFYAALAVLVRLEKTIFELPDCGKGGTNKSSLSLLRWSPRSCKCEVSECSAENRRKSNPE